MPDDLYPNILEVASGTTPKPRQRSPLDLIAKYESGGRNIHQNIVPAGGGFNPSVGRVTGPSSAQGPWQITNTTWRRYAPKAGAGEFRNAMSAPVETQRRVAQAIFDNEGFAPWAPYNARLRNALRRGEGRIQSQSEPQQDPYRDILKIASGDSGQTPSPASKSEQSATSPVTATSVPRVRGPQTAEQALANIMRSTNEATEKLKRQAARQERRARRSPVSQPQINLIDKSVPNMVGMLTAARNSPDAQLLERVAAPEFDRLKRNQEMRKLQYSGPERANIAHTLKSDEALREEANEIARQQIAMEGRRPEIDALKKKLQDFAGETPSLSNLITGAKPTGSHKGRMSRSVFGSLASSGVQLGNLVQIITQGARGEDLVDKMRIAQQAIGELEHEDPNQGWVAAAERALPGAGFEASKMMLMSGVPGVGRLTLPGLGALSEADKGIGPAAVGAVKGELFHRGMAATNTLNLSGRVAAGVGPPTVIGIAEGQDPKEALLSNLAFAPMVAVGGERAGRSTDSTPPVSKIEQRVRDVFPESEVVRKPLSLSRSERKDLKITEDSVDGFEVTLPNEQVIRVVPERGLIWGRPRGSRDTWGSYDSFAQLIEVAKHSGKGTLSHEKFHMLMDLVYTPEEKAAIIKRYGSEERAAEAYRRRETGMLDGTIDKMIFDPLVQLGTRLRNYIQGGDPIPANEALNERMRQEGEPLRESRRQEQAEAERIFAARDAAEKEFPVGSRVIWNGQEGEVQGFNILHNGAIVVTVKTARGSVGALANQLKPIEEGVSAGEIQNQTQSNVPPQQPPPEPIVETTPPIAEPPPAGVSGQANINSGVSSQSTTTLRKWLHADFGEVTESPNQTRVGKGRVRVIDKDGREHVIKRASLSGAGNQRAIPVKGQVEPEPQPQPTRTLPPIEEGNFRRPLRDFTDTLYREVGPDSLLDVLPTSRRMTDMADVYLSNTPDLALGQGRNKGIRLEFDPGDLEGHVNRSKPSWELLYEQGQAEFIARYNKQTQFQQALKSVTIKPDVQMSRAERMQIERALGEMEQAGWTKSTDADGSVTYRRPENVSVADSATKGPPPEPPTEPAPETPPPDSTTAAKKASMASDRADLDLPELSPAERKSWQESLNEAKPERAGLLADEVLQRPRVLNDSETASLVVRAQQIKNEHAAKLREIESTTDSDTLQRQQAELNALEAEFDKLSTATKQSGTEKGRALAAQKLTINQDFDLVSVVAGLKAAKGRELTPKERAQAKAWVKEKEQLEARIAELESNAQMKNVKRVIDRESRQKQRSISKQTLDDEFADLRAQFAQARAETKGVQPSGLAGIDPEGKLTKLILKMARNRVQAGTVEAKALVDEIFTAIKEHAEDLTERDVIEALTATQKRNPRSDAAKKLAELRAELRKQVDADEVAAGRLTATPQGPPKDILVKDLRRQRQIEEQIADLEEQIHTGIFKEKAEREPPRYTKETYRLQKRLDEIRGEYARAKYRATRGRAGLLMDTVAGSVNVPKTLLSMGDVSALLRQGGIGFVQHPVLSTRAARDMLQSFTAHGFANVEQAIKNHPDFDLAKRSKLEFTGVDRKDAHLSHREEGYLGSDVIDTLARQPVLGKAITPVKLIKDVSERTFVSFLDSQRMRIFSEQASRLRDMNLSPKELKDALDSTAQYTNIITGRGSLGHRGNQAAPLLNMAMFSPRLLASRVQFLNKMLNPVAWARMPKGARELQMKDNLKFLVATAGMLALAKAAGAGVNTDPNDADFLKIRIGNTRYDTLTGLQQPMRFLYRMAQAMRGGETYAGDTKSKILGDFTRSKAAPGAGLIWDYMEGKNRLTGKKFEKKDIATQGLIPLPAKDISEAIKEDGALRGTIEALPSLLGVGTQTYKDAAEKPKTPAEKLSRRFIQRKLGDDEGRTQEEIDTDVKKAQLRARSRRGEDVSAEIAAIGSKLTEKQAKRILSARNKTRLQEDFNTLGPKEAILVWSVASPEQRKELQQLIEKKAALIDLRPPDEQPLLRQKFIDAGIPLGTSRPSRPSRVSRESRQ